ncbi:MAG: hypothetical protein CL600_12505 [Alteromonas sp.]|jgi:uncharacterized protein YciI|uniref:YciI-like protein n=1 Tax=unclassified Alteromonas TaxID=2614992 RepID=UPI0009040CC2|nr:MULTISPECIES: YciI-like protein [unclassified Alteromonas]APE04801.1 hypothetical protein BM528_02630 [Alteromonas sp. RW2A1]AUC87193.1 hypothetical protein CW735_02440 [Alteromonas sp. MB-3u-76]MAI65671.1 hypothetical protein [Alteromonas sp.]
MYFLLTYEVTSNYEQARAPYREQHLALAKAAADAGELCLGGAVADPADSAILVFKGSSKDVAEKFALNDPYVINGVVTRWAVRQWNVVIGAYTDITTSP